MIDKLEKIVEWLTKNNKTISTMESCTGGGLVNYITNVDGASNILKFSAITYSNEFKIKMGVSKDIIDKFSVYSMETAMEMSRNICKFTDSNYGIGITGKLNKCDVNNLYGNDNIVYVSIFDNDTNKYYNKVVEVSLDTKKENKDIVVNIVIDMFLNII